MIELRGHSGAIVCVMSDAEGVYVRKSAATPDKNERLRLQSEKQSDFFRAGIPCPQVLRSGYSNGLYFFDMEYICGESLTNYLSHGNEIPSALEKCLLDLTRTSYGNDSDSYSSVDFLEKISRIKSSIQNTNYYHQSNARLIIEHMIDLKWPDVRKTACHGDLTFDNILVGRDGVFLIDFDSVDISSTVIDYSKLFQDTRGFWCLRGFAKNDVDVANIYSKFAKFDKLLAEYVYREFGIDNRLCNQYAAFHLLRTLPYSRSFDDFTFALDAIDRLFYFRKNYEH